MRRRPPRSTRTDTLFPYTTLFRSLWRSFPGKTGIAVRRIDGEWELSQRGEELFPQQSVSKLWVALTVLDAIDRGELSFNRKVRIGPERSEEHTSELQSLMRISYAVFCLTKKTENIKPLYNTI